MAPGTTVSMKLNGIQRNDGSPFMPLTPPDSAEITDNSLEFTTTVADKSSELSVRNSVSGKSTVDIFDVATQTECDPVTSEAKTIFLDICNLVSEQLHKKNSNDDPMASWEPKSSASATMYRVAIQLLVKHSIVYASIVAKLNLIDDQERIDYFAFRIVCDEVLQASSANGRPQVSWGRIVALFAFFIQVARDCHRRQLDRAAIVIANFIGVYVGERISPWITEQGGWASLERTFPAADHVEQKVWKGLLLTGIGLGVLATAIKAIR